MTQQQFLERDSLTARVLELQRLRAETADGTRGNLQYEHIVRADAALGVDGAVIEPQRLHGIGDAAANPFFGGAVCARGRHVDRFLEERPLQRVGLIEQCKGMESTAIEQALESELSSVNVALDLDQIRGWIAHGTNVRGVQQSTDTVERSEES